MSSSSLAFGRPAPSLSDLPVEILDIILGELNRSGNRSMALGNALRLNKRISSLAVKYIYRGPTWHLSEERALQRFDTMLSSANGSTFYPYYVYPEELSVRKWLEFSVKGKIVHSELQQIVGKILGCKKVRALRLELPRDLLFLAELPKCDISFLKDINISVEGNVTDDNALVWTKAMTSRMRLDSLEICLRSSCSLDFLDLPKNSLSSVSLYYFRNKGPNQGFIQRLLSSQSESLKSVSVSRSEFEIVSPISLPNLQSINVKESHMVGWENLSGSLKSLKSLYFYHMSVSGTPLFISDPARLERLELRISDKTLAATWLRENYRSFSGLCVLELSSVAAEILATILGNCSSLVKFESFDSTDEHLQAISRPGLASLESLRLCYGRFSSHGLSAFIAAFPLSISRLSLSGSYGLTPSNFRQMLKLPSLRYLDVSDMRVEPKDLLELEEIASKEQPPRLRVKWSVYARKIEAEDV